MERPSLYDVFEDLSLDELISALFTAQSEARQANARLRKLEFEVTKRMTRRMRASSWVRGGAAREAARAAIPGTGDSSRACARCSVGSGRQSSR